MLDNADDVSDAPNAKTIDRARGAIAFENVAFGYTPERLIVHDVNLRIEPGETVAFVGGTGAGKSTLLSLVPRFYDPNAGRVLLDGLDLRAITKKSLRDQISIVLQDTLLFSTTMRENIAYGRPEATEEEIIEAAKRAQAHEFIMAMPDGYREPGRRTRRAPERRPAAAPRHRPGLFEKRADPAPRRADHRRSIPPRRRRSCRRSRN